MKPKNCPIDPNTGLRKATLLPEEAIGRDRIPDQLMYLPPKCVKQNKMRRKLEILLFSLHIGVKYQKTERTLMFHSRKFLFGNGELCGIENYCENYISMLPPFSFFVVAQAVTPS